MAKNLKVIKCPNCGSVKKIEIKPDYFLCQNCDTEYVLDDDDININLNHAPNPQQSQAQGLKNNIPLIIGFILFISFIIALGALIPSEHKKQNPVEKQREKLDFFGANMLYENPQTGEAMYFRVGREFIDDGGRSDDVNTHVLFINPITKKLIKEELYLNARED